MSRHWPPSSGLPVNFFDCHLDSRRIEPRAWSKIIDSWIDILHTRKKQNWQKICSFVALFFDIFKRKRKRGASSTSIFFFFFFLPLFHNFSKLSRIQPKSLLLIEKTCVGNEISHVGENFQKCLIFKKVSFLKIFFFIKLELIFTSCQSHNNSNLNRKNKNSSY